MRVNGARQRVALRLAGRKGPKPYTWLHAAKWELDGWNGVSYDGIGRSRRPEANEILRMRFRGHKTHKGKRSTMARVRISMLKGCVRTYRGNKRRRMLDMYRKALA